MRLRTAFVLACVLIAAMAASARAADVSGKWVAQVPDSEGQPQKNTFNFKVDGSSLTGTVSGKRGKHLISEGRVSGDEITFVVNLRFNGNQMVMTYDGKISGDEITFTCQIAQSGRVTTQRFTAKRSK